MRRALVNVATGGYHPAQHRLVECFRKMDPDCQIFPYRHIPEDWPAHEAKPYAFKAYALNDIAHMTDLVLWCDAVMVPVRDLAPLWEKIERDGYWLALNGWTNYEWTADSAYPALFPGLELEEAREQNKQFPQVVATAFGLNLRHPLGWGFLREYYRLASETDAFCGPWSNSNNPKAHPQSPDRMAPCGPADVLGHRHDQTAASVIAWRLGMKLTPCPAYFSYHPHQQPSTVLVADGGMALCAP